MAWTQNDPPLASADLFSILGNGKSPRKLQSARIKIEPEWCVRYAIRDRVHQELLPIVRNDVLLFGDALHSSAEVRQNAIKMDVEQLLTVRRKPPEGPELVRQPSCRKSLRSRRLGITLFSF